MGQAKLKRLKHEELRSGRFICVYCGTRPANTVDHMPPKGAFNLHQRPNELEFPACNICNDATRAIDNIICWISRLQLTRDPVNDAEFKQLCGVVLRNYPEVFTSLNNPTQVNFARLPSGLVVPYNVSQFTFDDYLGRVLNLFGLKFALAMHWSITRRQVSPDDRVLVYPVGNGSFVLEEMPQHLLNMFPQVKSLKQGKKSYGGQFVYTSVFEGNENESIHFCGFRDSIGIFASFNPVIDDGLSEVEKTILRSKLMKPSDLHMAYPFGLPRLTREQLSQRERWKHTPSTLPLFPAR